MCETPLYTLNCADYISLRELEHLEGIPIHSEGQKWTFLAFSESKIA